MALLIDTYNVLHRGLPDAPDEPGADILHLARRIASSRFAGESSIILACDGVPPAGVEIPAAAHGCRILFAGPGREADALIEQLIIEDTAPARLIVVSSDRRILKAARKRRARTLDSARFLFQLAAPAPERAAAAGAKSGPAPKRDVPLKEGEVRDWMKFFGEQPAPVEPSAEGTPAREAPPVSPAAAEPPRKPGPPRGAPVDRGLERLLRESGERIAPEDLDMSRWLGEGGPRKGG